MVFAKTFSKLNYAFLTPEDQKVQVEKHEN